MAVLTLIFAVMVVCCSCIFKYCKLSDVLFSAFDLFCWLVTVNTLILAIFHSIFVFPKAIANYQQEGQDSTTMCQFVGAPTYTLVLFYLFIGLLCLSVTASCCYIGKQKEITIFLCATVGDIQMSNGHCVHTMLPKRKTSLQTCALLLYCVCYIH